MLDALFDIFVIAALGYLIGSIKIKGIMLGSAGILLVALIFGHFGAEIPDVIRNIGLVLFVAAVGLSAGPKFFRDFKHNAKSYILLGAVIILCGTLVCVLVIKLFDVSSSLAVGMLTGALTSTPGLAAAQEAAKDEAALATTGYAIAYPFGIFGVILFVQVVPKILKADIKKEREKLKVAYSTNVKKSLKAMFNFDGAGYFSVMLTIVFGILIGLVEIPLPGGSKFSLGYAGGPLIAGLLVGHFSKIGRLDFSVPKEALNVFREFGLALFLIGAGVDGGRGFVSTLQSEGPMLFVYGAFMTMVPMVVGYFIAAKILHLSLFNNLGSITGGMTSTPALGSLIQVAKTDDVATSYAATYPIALVFIVLCSQFTILLT